MIECQPGSHVETICVPDSAPVWTDLGVIPAIAASPTALGRVIAQLHGFGGRIYLGYGDWNQTAQPGCDLIAYDPQAGAFVTLTHVATDALWSLRTVAFELWALATDPEIGADPDAVIVSTTGAMQELRGGLSPYPWHLFDAITFNGQVYLAGADRKTGLGSVWRSDRRSDGATIWPVVATRAGRCYALFVLAGRLYAVFSDGRALSTADGKAWTLVKATFPLVSTKPINHGGAIYLRSGWPALGNGPLIQFDGTHAQAVNVVADHTSDGESLWELVDDEIFRDGERVTEAPSRSASIEVLGGVVYVGTTDSRLWRYGALG